MHSILLLLNSKKCCCCRNYKNSRNRKKKLKRFLTWVVSDPSTFCRSQTGTFCAFVWGGMRDLYPLSDRHLNVFIIEVLGILHNQVLWFVCDHFLTCEGQQPFCVFWEFAFFCWVKNVTLIMLPFYLILYSNAIGSQGRPQYSSNSLKKWYVNADIFLLGFIGCA